MTRDQSEAAYYAWCRSQAMYEAARQLYPQSNPPQNYHDLVGDPYSKFLFAWLALTYTVVEYLYKFDEIPLEIREDCRNLRESWKKFRNAVFHIKNHPLSEEYDALIHFPKSFDRIANIHDVCGKYVHHQLGFQFPAFVGTPARFFVPVLTPSKPKQ